MSTKDVYKKQFLILLEELYLDTKNIIVWSEIAKMFDIINYNEERDISLDELLQNDIKKVIPKDYIIWLKIFSIDKENILALEKIIEYFIEIIEDFENGIKYIKN